MQRLKTRAQFQAVLAGKTVARTAHFALHRAALDVSPVPTQAASKTMPSSTGPESMRPQALFAVDGVWVGAMVPKRWAKRAVTRNTIKRQIYQVVQAFEPRFPQAAHVVRLRGVFDRKEFISATSDQLKLAVRSELEQLFDRAATVAATPA
ncbi:ribonuclease P protein component [Rhodoferax sp.]|uniref:ribonuclease P protein component n=1 Tax=Rhodoferax sp. TaxID=50421 RepID=UPI00374CDC94